jgi:hypothetical protein
MSIYQKDERKEQQIIRKLEFMKEKEIQAKKDEEQR